MNTRNRAAQARRSAWRPCRIGLGLQGGTSSRSQASRCAWNCASSAEVAATSAARCAAASSSSAAPPAPGRRCAAQASGRSRATRALLPPFLALALLACNRSAPSTHRARQTSRTLCHESATTRFQPPQ